MSFCYKVDALMFPYDFGKVNGKGICLSPCWYTVFRITMFILYGVDFGYCAYFFQEKDLLFFTNWGLMITMFCGLTLLVENLLNWCLQGCTDVKYWKVSHFIFTITFVFELFITGVYWGGLFPYAVVNLWGQIGMYDILNPIMAHLVPVVLLIIDMQFNLIVVWNSIYIAYQFGLLTLYLMANCVYSLDKAVVYDLITYRNWMTYLFLLACAVVIVVCHFVARLYCRFCKQQRVVRFLQQANQQINLFVPAQITQGDLTLPTLPNTTFNPTLNPTFNPTLNPTLNPTAVTWVKNSNNLSTFKY